MPESKEAGEGDNFLYRLVPPGQSPQRPLSRDEDYVAVDAASWFINKDSSWFKKRTASGTMTIALAGGLEQYHAALGTFELQDGARTAPVFDRPLLPDRRYRGGPLTFAVTLTSLERDTAFASVLKSAASASLNIVGGMVETATLAGPQQILGAAGSELVRGIGAALANSAPGREPLFGSEGMEATLQPADLEFPVTYLLFHRGSRLDAKKLKVGVQGQVSQVEHDGARLEDGAWMLLRLRKESSYRGVRPWDESAEKLRANVANLVDDAAAGVLTRADALDQLRPGGEGRTTLFDELTALRRTIRDDGVLTSRDGGARARVLTQVVTEARMRLMAMSSEEPVPPAPAATMSMMATLSSSSGDWSSNEVVALGRGAS
jgi:hypothetical protein